MSGHGSSCAVIISAFFIIYIIYDRISQEIETGSSQKEKFGARPTKREEIERGTVLLITAISPKPCQGDLGDYVHIQSIQNKLQYTQRKKFDFYFGTNQVDPELIGAWNKLALVHQILEKNLNYEWIFWIDVDALIVDMVFNIPLQDYSNYDFVSYGDEDLLYKKANTYYGLNTGVFLVRNNDWGRNLIKKACELGKNRADIMKAVLSNYDPTLRDQNAVGFLLHQD